MVGIAIVAFIMALILGRAFRNKAVSFIDDQQRLAIAKALQDNKIFSGNVVTVIVLVGFVYITWAFPRFFKLSLLAMVVFIVVSNGWFLWTTRKKLSV